MVHYHAVFLHHGLWGYSSNLDFLISQLGDKRGDGTTRLLFANCSSSEGTRSYDGIDICGDRFIEFILGFLKEKEAEGISVEYVSFIGYSMGGLYCRYAIGKLFVLNFFDKHTPVNFLTIAAPNLGITRPASSVFNIIFNTISSRLVLRTGNQIQIIDNYMDGIPLLVFMSDPRHCFHQALAKFKKPCLVSNIRNDFMVRFTTSSISPSNPYTRYKHIQPLPEKYPSIVNYDQGCKREKDVWTFEDFRLVGFAALLSPLILPVVLTVSFIIMPMSVLTRYWQTRHQRGDVSWLQTWWKQQQQQQQQQPHEQTAGENAAPCSTTDRLRRRKPQDTASSPLSSSSPPSPPFLSEKDRVSVRKWMVDSLNRIGWTRVDCSLFRTNAHAAVIVRRPALMKHKDVVEYIVDCVFEE